MKRTKFKIGDKVRILPSAVSGGVSEKAVGKIGKITSYNPIGYFLVVMCNRDDDTSYSELPLPWGVYHNQMEPAVEVGEQLLFAFMLEEE